MPFKNALALLAAAPHCWLMLHAWFTRTDARKEINVQSSKGSAVPAISYNLSVSVTYGFCGLERLLFCLGKPTYGVRKSKGKTQLSLGVEEQLLDHEV